MAIGVLTGKARVFHCELDDWDFDAGLTDGVCPICGWAPEGGLQPLPEWMQRLQQVQWDFVGLLVLAAFLVISGILVAQAAHIFRGH
ncbi:MAG TPA: hypothetical protein VIN56_09770 [Candidatus Dormibacteraeota bacterium]|jgi:hypothetical protein